MLLASGALALRRSRPVLGLGLAAAAAVLDAVAGPSLLPLPILVYLLHQVAVHGPARAAPWMPRGGYALAVLAALAVLLDTGNFRHGLLTAMCTALVLVWPSTTGLSVRAHRERAEQARRGSTLERFKTLAQERARMAGDLHDIVGNRLSAIALQSTAALATAPDDERHLTALAELRRTSLEGVGEVRSMVAALRTDEACPASVPASLDYARTLLDRVERLGSPVRLRTVGTPVALCQEVETAACRIIQESLTNVVKHAGGSVVETVLAYRENRLVITVQNELPAAPPAPERPGSGYGLVSMSDRAERIGGSCTARRYANRWRVDAVLPLRPAGTVRVVP
ncbi:histidine kinase [Actinomadura sp. GC306]|uniref:sensor histidine kinase n=1 Tax=Actinomadura sp. GC306 TaxID=2530367 RepID=UPI001405406E|nr:histidine kinase [Actinomadura sp. GC306]